jgi:hypothetical protein
MNSRCPELGIYFIVVPPDILMITQDALFVALDTQGEVIEVLANIGIFRPGLYSPATTRS